MAIAQLRNPIFESASTVPVRVTEPAAASAATEPHRLVGRAVLHVVGPAERTAHPVRPSPLNEPLLGCGIVREQLEQFRERQTLAAVIPWCLVSHVPRLPSWCDTQKCALTSALAPFDISPFLKLAPAMDHPELGLTDPTQAEALLAGFADAGAAAGSSKGGDRASLRLHPADEQLIAAAAAVCGRVVVAVMAGSAVVMPWLDTVDAALMVWYPGSEGGHALADVLFGHAEPGGRLPFAIPHEESDLVDFDRDAETAVSTPAARPPISPSVTASATPRSNSATPR